MNVLSSTFIIALFEPPAASHLVISKLEDHFEPAFSPALNEGTQVGPPRPHILQPHLLGRAWLEKCLPAISMSLKVCFFPFNHQNNKCRCRKFSGYRKIQGSRKMPITLPRKENSHFAIFPSNLFFCILCSLYVYSDLQLTIFYHLS